MKRRILRKLRAVVAASGLVGASFCTAVPLDGCEGYLEAILRGASVASGVSDDYDPGWGGDWDEPGEGDVARQGDDSCDSSPLPIL